MDSKLTLKLDKRTIEKAKKYAKANKTSLSRMVESYLHSLTSSSSVDQEVTPLVDSLTGVIKIEESDYKKGYTDYLSEKYK